MKGMTPLLCLAALVAQCVATHVAAATDMKASEGVSPVQKVVQMLTDMKVKGEKALETEKAGFAEYVKWKDGRVQELGFEIKDAKARIEKLTAVAAEKDSKVERLGQAIKTLDEEVGRMAAERSKAEEERKHQNEEFIKVQKDHVESVDALGRAIKTLQAQPSERPQAQAAKLLQELSDSSEALRPAVAALVQEGSAHRQAPEVAAFKTSSAGITKTLQELLEKFKAQLADVEKEEAKKANAHQLAMLDLGNAIKRSTADKEQKATAKAQHASESAQAKTELQASQQDLAEAEKVLADVSAAFSAKSATFAENQKVRQQELEALAKAVEIMSGKSVAGSYQKRVKLLQLQSRRAASLLQLRSSSASAQAAAARERAASFLQRRAKAIDSKALALFAADVAADPFAKVIKMMKDLLANLKEQEAAEATHQKWCEEQLSLNKQQREEKAGSVAKLAAQSQELTAQIQSMSQQIQDLGKELADLAASMEQATAQRSKEAAENKQVLAEAKEGGEAVHQAILVLSEFYASQAPALLQQQEEAGLDQEPAVEAYKGMQDSKGGVIGMLEVVQSDFLRLEQETKAAEQQASEAFDKLSADSAAAKAEKSERAAALKQSKGEAEAQLASTKKDLASNEAELAKANEYFESLKPTCVDNTVSYEERAAKRQQELDALKQVSEILGNQPAA